MTAPRGQHVLSGRHRYVIRFRGSPEVFSGVSNAVYRKFAQDLAELRLGAHIDPALQAGVDRFGEKGVLLYVILH